MKTQLLNKDDLSKAAALIKDGENVAFPTDTVYGLGADATNDAAVQKVYQAKGRPKNRPINVLIGQPQDIKKYALDITDEVMLLAETFWPGPFTLILKSAGVFSPYITAGKDTVGLRMPDNEIALDFIKRCGVPLATPSANSSGRPSPTLAEHVMDDLGGKISAVVDGGSTSYGIESTILDFSDASRPLLLRPGHISKEDIEKVIEREVFLNESTLHEKENKNEKHYEPKIPVFIVKSSWEEAIEKLARQDEKIAILANQAIVDKFSDSVTATFSLGEKNDLESANRLLFQGLRTLERSEATVIIGEAYTDGNLSVPYMNRLESAADKKTI